MGSDISRFTFDPDKHYSSVRQQQGRVNLDADWNEQVDIVAHRVSTEAADVIGGSGAPRDNAGFQIQAPGQWAPSTSFALGATILDPNGGLEIVIAAGTSGVAMPAWPTTLGNTVADGTGLTWQLVKRDLAILPGCMYVDGLLCELSATPIPIENFTGDGTGAPGTQVRISPETAQTLELAPGQFMQISAQGSAAPAPLLVQITAVNAAVGSLTFATAVNTFGAPNINAQLQRLTTYLTQPDYPSPRPLPAGGTSIVYLDVWERTVTALEDPGLLEVALGGPDTTTRGKIVCQVKVVDAGAAVSCATPESSIPTWEHVIRASAAQLTTGVAQSTSSGPCCITSNNAFTGMENQLYRVEIHQSGIFGWKANTPFSIGAEILDSNGNLEVAAVPGVSGATPPVWATAVGADTTDGGVTWRLVSRSFRPLWAPGTAFNVGDQVVDSNGNVETAVSPGTSGGALPAWPTTPGATITDGTTGLRWQLATPSFKWSRDNGSVATAVTGIASVTNTAGNPASQLTVQSLGRDQVLGFAPGNWVEITDDWQELNRRPGELHQIDSIDVAAKTITLDSPVSTTSFPTTLGQTDPSRHTRLTRWDQSGKVYLSDSVTVWADLGAAGSTGDIPVPPPGTTLLLENGITVAFGSNPVNGPIYTGDYWIFAARTADGSVEPLVQASPRGVQHHFSRLGTINFDAKPWLFQDCRRLFPPLADPGVHVTGAFLSSGAPLLNDGTIGLQTDLAHGINVICDAPLDPATITQPSSAAASGAQATCFVTVNAPAMTGGALIGLNPIVLSANVTLDASKTIIGWTPIGASVTGLANLIAAASFPPVLARLTLKGSFIWAQGNPQVYLQGNVLGTPYVDGSGIRRTGLLLPSGTGRRGGDFEMWFWLISAPPVTLSATSVNFGNQLVGTSSAAQSVTLTNNNAASVSIALAGADPAEFGQTNTCASVAVGQTCTISVTFTPAVTGARIAQINISAGGSVVAVIALAGAGIQPGLSASAASLAFGIVTVGSASAPQTVTLTNSGNAQLTIGSVTITGANATSFTTETNTCGGPLAPGASCAVTVQFVPATSGGLTAALNVASNAPGSPLVINLSGTGVIKTKDSKDSKDAGDRKPPITEKSIAIEKSIAAEKITDVKVSDKAPISEVLKPSPILREGAAPESEGQGTGRTFIKPEERPPVGRKARKKPKRQQ